LQCLASTEGIAPFEIVLTAVRLGRVNEEQTGVIGYPHIAGLWYRLKADELVDFSNPQPVERHTNAFYLRLEEAVLTVWMNEHHATENSARERVERYLRSWEISAALQHDGRPEVSFEFERSDMLDLKPPDTWHTEKRITAGTSADIRYNVHVARQSYPEPPDDFDLSEDVEVMWSLYNAYRQGHDRLLPMAYTCLSRLEYSAGGRKEAARRYRVDTKVLGKLGEFTSTLGIGTEARKLAKGSNNRSPTAAEKMWIETTIRTLIRRAGEVAHDPHEARSLITMNNLSRL
jgi:hypothetical protein